MARPLQRGLCRLLLLLVTRGQLCYAHVMQAAADSSNGGSVQPPAVLPTAYKIGVGDVLHILVWGEPQLTETAVVRPDGKVSLPLVSELKVAGLTPEAVQQTLTEQLIKFVR